MWGAVIPHSQTGYLERCTNMYMYLGYFSDEGFFFFCVFIVSTIESTCSHQQHNNMIKMNKF